MDTMTITRKIQLRPIGDKEEINRVYKYLRDGMYAQNRAYNILISNVYASIIAGKSKNDIAELYKRGARNPKESDKEYSLYDFNDFSFPTGLATSSGVTYHVKADIKTAQKNGLFKGKTALPNKKLDAPLWTPNRFLGFRHEYENHMDFLDVLYTNQCNIYMDFVNDIKFEVVLGQAHKSHEIRSVFQNIFEENYKVCDSSIQIDDKKIMLNLSIQVPKKTHKLDENVVVGVDLGLAIPAVCSLNISEFECEYIGSVNDFLRVRTRIQSEKRRLQKALKNTNGGHGRKKKLAPLDRHAEYERNFVKTYNHMISKKVVEFALKHNAKYINLECLKGFDTDKFILRNWSYYELQQFITYKAALHGIEVRLIDPYHTSQECSCCGHWEEGQRISQSVFICKNPNCKMYSKEVNADKNASRNIALSTKWAKELEEED